MPAFSERSKKNLETCDKRLQDLFNEVIKYLDITIICGQRGEIEQNQAYDEGNSKLRFPDSKHNKTPSLAVDVAIYPIDYSNIRSFYYLAGYVQAIADRLGTPIKWGGSWKNFPDYDHWELFT